LSEWGERTRRDLPWRRTREPWAVLVSELMLQQTQVARVLPRYEAFLARFPTVGDCAAAPRADIVRLWAGLGYNRRAVNLHRCAAIVVDHHGGRLPSSVHDLMALPGIGPYTARAVAAFAFEQDVGIIDTNAARVLARLRGRALSRADAQAQADALVPEGRGWAWNQAMLDLGATVCTSRAPRCHQCPVADGCSWHARGGTDPDPAIGSAGVSTGQSVFEGSDRQGRGRLVDALCRDGAIGRGDLADRAGWRDDAPRAERAAESLVRDGLAAWDGARLVLPG
jgi:A/G-specific adenine glycosylase